MIFIFLFIFLSSACDYGPRTENSGTEQRELENDFGNLLRIYVLREVDLGLNSTVTPCLYTYIDIKFMSRQKFGKVSEKGGPE